MGSLSLWLIKKLKRRRVYYENCSRKKKRLYDVISVPYMLIYYLTFIGFIYNLLYGLLRLIGWLLSKFSVYGLSNFLMGWPGFIVNIFFPVIILGFIFMIWADVWVGDPIFFRDTFKYRVMRW